MAKTHDLQNALKGKMGRLQYSVSDPDLYVFGPPESGAVSQRYLLIRIRILLSSSKNSKKNLDSYCFVTSFLLFFFEKNDENVPSKSR
jgi:hypothetical protein